MKDSIFWKKWFIPVYFIVGLLCYWTFEVYLDAFNAGVYLLIVNCVGCGIASIYYNNRSSKE